jgi:uncharacterized membrane protein
MTGRRRIQVGNLWLTIARVHLVAVVVAVFCLAPIVTWGQEARGERTTAAGVYTDDQANRGQVIFGQRCANCHGETLDGEGMAPSLRGREFLSTWQGRPLRRIYSRIISTMPPDDVGSLTEDETLMLVALLLRANKYPAGSTALTRADELDSIIVAPLAGVREPLR